MVHKKLNSIRAAVYALVLALGALIAPPNTVYGQSSGDVIKVSGTVTDREKTPLIGVGVLVKGTTTGTSTDIDGHFYLDVPSKESVLEFSYLGFKTLEVPVGAKISFNIVLYEDSSELDGVVVTGFGHQKRLSVIGSVETIDPDKLQVGSTRSLSNNLAGQLSGVIAFKPSGEPGYDDSNFWIRGIA